MKYEEIAAVNGATMAYAAAVQAYIAAQEFYLKMWEAEPNSLPGGIEDISFAEETALNARVHLETAERRLSRYIDEYQFDIPRS